MNRTHSIEELAAVTRSTPPESLAADEAFWTTFAGGYDRDDSFSQLNYGYFHPSLRSVLEVEIATSRELNRRGSTSR